MLHLSPSSSPPTSACTCNSPLTTRVLYAILHLKGGWMVEFINMEIGQHSSIFTDLPRNNVDAGTDPTRPTGSDLSQWTPTNAGSSHVGNYLILDEEMMSAKVLQMFLQNWCCKLQVIGQNQQNALIYDLCLLSWLHNQTTTYTSCRHYHQLYCLHILHIFVIISAMKSRQSHKLSKLAYHFGVLCSWFFL